MATTKATMKQLTTVLGAVPLFEGLSKKQLKKVADLADVAALHGRRHARRSKARSATASTSS